MYYLLFTSNIHCCLKYVYGKITFAIFNLKFKFLLFRICDKIRKKSKRFYIFVLNSSKDIYNLTQLTAYFLNDIKNGIRTRD